MAHPLEGNEIYFAAMADMRDAERRVNAAVKYGVLPNKAIPREAAFRAELECIWQARIDRGELPPLTPELQKAS